MDIVSSKMINSLLHKVSLCAYRDIIKVLCESIVLHIPRSDWPKVVELLYQDTFADILGLSEDMKSDTVAETISEPNTSHSVDNIAKDQNPISKNSNIRSGIDWDKQPLGKVSDNELAKKLGVSHVAVGRARTKRGILPFSKRGSQSTHREPGKKAGINWDKQPLGKISDSELAKKLGVDRSTVRKARIVREKRSNAIELQVAKVAEVVEVAKVSKVAEVKKPVQTFDIKPKPKPKPKPIKGLPSISPESTEHTVPVFKLINPVELNERFHVHKCAVCFKIHKKCEDHLCDPKLDLPDGTLMVYETCENCLSELSQQSSGCSIFIPKKLKQSDI